MVSVTVDQLDDLSKMILYAVNTTGGIKVNETHLQKMIFQIMKVMKKDPKMVGYRPHNYGPYSDMVNEGKDALLSYGLLDSVGGRIMISEEAREEVSLIRLPESMAFKVGAIAHSLSSLNNDELLLMVYYDDMKYDDGYYLENSEIKDHVLDCRISTAIHMYESRKATLERSSELAGMNIRDFKKLLLDVGRYRIDD